MLHNESKLYVESIALSSRVTVYYLFYVQCFTLKYFRNYIYLLTYSFIVRRICLSLVFCKDITRQYRSYAFRFTNFLPNAIPTVILQGNSIFL